MTTKTPFDQAYSTLNPQQKIAVDSIDGPVMVIAGPGTGKTQILTTRIANIIKKTDTPPSAILALTYTDSAAKNMRARLLQLIGPAAYQVYISTFHAFAASVIQDNPESFSISPTSLPLSDLERFQIIQNLLDTNQFDFLKPVNTPHYYAKAIIGSIQDLKREGFTPPQFQTLLKKELQELESQQDSLSKTEFDRLNKNLQKNLELLTIYHHYQDTLSTSGRFDFEDMINFVRDAFITDPDLLAVYQERFHYFLVDEYQDTNSAQNHLLFSLSKFWGPQANIFVVGDDEQSIFRFQGASLENALQFIKLYPQAQVITLKQNYRSSQLILDASRALITHNQNSLASSLPQIERSLTSQSNQKASKITLVNTPHYLLEQIYLVSDIQKKLKAGSSPGQIAVIVRNNADLQSLADTFTHFHLPFSQKGGLDILKTPIIKYLILLLGVVQKSKLALDDLDLFTLLQYPFVDFDPLEILKLSRFASSKKTTLLDVISSPDFQKKSPVSDPQAFIDFINHLATWQQVASQKTFSQFFETLINDSGLLDWALNSTDSSQHLLYLNAFYDLVKSLNASDHQLHLDQFLDYLRLLQINNLSISAPELDLDQNKIIITTAHKAKGLEWDHVYITSFVDGRWGNNSTRDLIKLPDSILSSQPTNHDPNEDERRLFYVALTRARQQVTITHADTYISYFRSTSASPSMFLSELPPQFLTNQTPDFDQSQVDQFLNYLLAPAISDQISASESEFIDSILKSFRLSITALNTYLQCAYKFKLNNIYKVPRAKESYLSFGTAVHTALERFYQYYQQHDRFPDKNYLIDQFQSALSREILTPEDLKTRLHQGKKILSVYYDFYQDDFRPSLFTEKYFGYSNSQLAVEDIPLAGKVDRIDWVDPESKTVRVVDYKTGKRKTRGQIEGSTKDSDGAYKRQLVFYKLLIDLESHFPATVVETELDFIQAPHDENKPGKEVFRITPEEVDDLKKIIISTMKSIRKHHFERTQDYSICGHCEFQKHCWPQGVPQLNSEQLSLLK